MPSPNLAVLLGTQSPNPWASFALGQKNEAGSLGPGETPGRDGLAANPGDEFFSAFWESYSPKAMPTPAFQLL